MTSALRALALMLPLLAAACGSAGKGEPEVKNAWVRLNAVPGMPAAGYFTITGGKADDRLLSIESPDAKRAELHGNMTHEGMTMMMPLADVPLPAGKAVSFAPGGSHAMLFDLGKAVKPGGAVALRFTLGSGARLEASARVIAAGDEAPRF